MLRSETAGEPARLARALEGLRRYQEAERIPPPPPPPAVAETGGACLRDYGGRGRAVVFVPSLINPPSILDMEGRSLLRWLAGRGVRPLLLDWGPDVAPRRGLGIAGHVEALLAPLVRELREPPALVGYCLGGTMALGAAALVEVAGIATIAAPWRFAGFPDEARRGLAGLWAGAGPAAERLGLLPMEALQAAFWSLDPARTVAKFEAFAAAEPGGERARAFVRLEDWANDGPPLPWPAARELFEAFFAGDATGEGRWLVPDPSALACPRLEIVSSVDRIVPAASAAGAGERLELALGHVGMMVGSSAREALWEPLAAWLSRL
ncbi:MAG: alpha/beta hydrolase [Alphaproteobacteria bacterium]|nr:alpha/beta hydrolase [Alphaproteobacteria bacterium]MBV9373281.1 alpha/beta hydrolase [Alphaproteobacteria bacterium]MBV9901244.1 alpha/beta hydrolase [Alphaproteobacteria bacterium]